MRKKWFWITAAAVVILSVFCYRFYIGIHAGHWMEEDRAVLTAYEQTALASAKKVEAFFGEESFMIVHGADKLGEEMIVWVGEQTVHAEYAKNGFSRERLLSSWQSADPSKELLRIMPGKIGNRYVWELYYKKPEDGKENYYYDYFDFYDGSWLDTYRLTLR